jgi:tellurite resistance protein TehA-like permease
LNTEPQSGSRQRTGAIARAIADLFPGYFALVMATGIISIAAFLLEMPTVALGLTYINVFAYALLLLMLLARVVLFFPNIRTDIADHMRGPGFFTVSAGTSVLGSQLIIVLNNFQAAAALWFAGIFFWVVTMYSFFTAVTIRETKPPLDKGLSGTWLISAVATQGVSVLGTLLSGYFQQQRELILFFTLCMFLIGSMLYMLLIILIFYRFTFLDLTSERLTPPYWINMGAVAITTLAGARLIIASGESPLLTQILPFLKGFTLFFWSGGTWWIPLLFILGFWRHVYMRYPLRYDPQYWGLVFPLGMYTVCTFQLSKALSFEPLMMIPKVFVYIAFAGWLAAAYGFLYSLFPRRSRA